MNNDKLSWVKIYTPVPGEDRLVPVVTNHLYMFLNEDYILPEGNIVGEIRLRHAYEELPPEYAAWVTDYMTGQRNLVGVYSTLPAAKKMVESWVNELLNRK